MKPSRSWLLLLCALGAAVFPAVADAAPPPLPRRWWVFLSPAEARALCHSTDFPLIRAETDTFFLNGVPWVKTGLDHSSTWLAEQAAGTEMLAATYLALKWGKYDGAPSPETRSYLDRLLFDWRDLVTAGPADLYQTSQPHHPGQYGGHGDPRPFSPGWYEGDIALRVMMAGGLTSYDAIRDDIPPEDRAMIDAWMRAVAPKLWANTNPIGQNRGASSHGQAHEMALLLQDKPLFESFFYDKTAGFVNALDTLDYAPDPECWFPQRAGISFQSAYDDGPHGNNINKHLLDTLLHITHAARHGGDPAWDVPARFHDQKLLTDICDTWHDIGGPLRYPFALYMRSVEASQNVQLSTTPYSVTGWMFFSYAWMQPRFNDIGVRYGASQWNYGGGLWYGANGQIALWKERARLLAATTEGARPAMVSTYTTEGHGLLEVPLSPQRGAFTAEWDLVARDPKVRLYFAFADAHEQKEGGRRAFGVGWNPDGQIVSRGGSLPWTPDSVYHLRVTADLRTRLYRVYVTPPGAPEQPLGKEAAFDAAVESVKYWSFKPDGSTDFEIRDFRLSQPENIRVRIAAPGDAAPFRAGGSITVNAEASAEGGGRIARVEFYQGQTKIGEAAQPPYRCVWANVPAGNHALTARAVDTAGSGRDSGPVTVAVGAPARRLPPDWRYADVGDGKIAGGAAADGKGVFTMRGPGQEIAHRTDEFGFAYQTLEGDGEIVARVVSLNPIFVRRQDVGVMIRAALDADAAHACLGLKGDHGLEFLTRAAKGAEATATPAGDGEKPPYFLRLTRKGDTLGAFKSADGKTWTPVGTATVPMGRTALIGLIANTGLRGNLDTAEFDGVALTGKVSPLPRPPVGLSAAALADGGIGLAWKSAGGPCAGFAVERSGNGIVFAEIARMGANTAMYADQAGLAAGTTYSYRVRAVAGEAVSDPSEADSATTAGDASALPPSPPLPPAPTVPPPTPMGLRTAVVSDTQINLDWNGADARVEGVEIESSHDGTHFAPLVQTRGVLTHYADIHLPPATHRVYRLCSYNAAGRSAWSPVAAADTLPPPPDPPQGFNAVARSPETVELSWQGVKGGGSIKIFRTSGSKLNKTGDLPNYTLVATASADANTAADTTALKPDFSYAYRAQRVDAAGRVSAWSDIVRVNTPGTAPRPNAPGKLAAVSDNAGRAVTLTWESDGANLEGFKIERSDDGAHWVQVRLIDKGSLTFADKDMVFSGTRYFYRVRAYASGGNVNSPFTAAVSVVTAGGAPPPTQPSNVRAQAISNHEVRVTWTPCSRDESGFKVFRSVDGNVFLEIGTVPAHAGVYTDAKAAPGTTYCYRVAAYNAAGNSADSEAGRDTTPP